MKWLQLALAWSLTLALAMPGQAQDKKKDKKKPVAEVIDAEKALQPGKISGKVTSASEGTLRLRVEYIHYELKPGTKTGAKADPQLQKLLRQQQQLARIQRELATARNPREQYKALQELQRLQQQIQLEAAKQQLGLAGGKGGQQNPLKEVKDFKDFDIELSDKVKQRTKFLPFAYDEMGNPKKYTDEEKKAAKGDETEQKLEGYKADGAKPGQEVTIILSKNKETENKLRGTFVLITKESTEPVKDEKKPRKKNK